MTRQWTSNDVMEIARAFQVSCVLVAAAELGLFDILVRKPLTARELAEGLSADVRATTILADALAAMELLRKESGRYGLAPGVSEVLTETAPQGMSAMVKHLANCLRSWAQLAQVTKTGRPAQHPPSIHGPEADLASFIEAMNDISRTMAPELIKAIGPPAFDHLLDLGGGPATWTIELLRAMPDAKATLFDLPEVIPIARRHIAAAGLQDRVTLVEGNFAEDANLPRGVDLAWVGAVIHMNSRRQNRQLFVKVHAALVDGGRILIRDVIMEPSHTIPASGAMFAVNMLVNTPKGGTYTFDEVNEDLQAAGFDRTEVLHRGEFMDSVIGALKNR